jgi:hypothetical protein
LKERVCRSARQYGKHAARTEFSRHTGEMAPPPHRGVTHTAASTRRVHDPSLAQSELSRRLRRGSLGVAGAVNREFCQRMLSTLIFVDEHVM